MKRNIPLMYAVGLTQGMVFYGPVATLYRQAQGVTVFEITLIESISMLLCILLEIPWGMVADRIGYKKTMVLSNLIFFASKLRLPASPVFLPSASCSVLLCPGCPVWTQTFSISPAPNQAGSACWGTTTVWEWQVC